MQYAERLPQLPSPKTLAAPLAALAIGAAAAYALIDNEQVVQEPSKVIVVDTPQPAGPGTAAKNEAGVAAAISPPPSAGEGTSAKNEAGVAQAITPTPSASEGTSAKDEAGVASAIQALEARGSQPSATGSSGSPSVQPQTGSDSPPELGQRFSGQRFSGAR